jgi:predicted DsbA family dithiol-disulfide isomerase
MESELRELLDGDMFADQIDQEAADARTRGISGVPHFLIQDKVAIDGAQDVQDFLTAFQEAKELESTTAGKTGLVKSGLQCADGVCYV